MALLRAKQPNQSECWVELSKGHPSGEDDQVPDCEEGDNGIEMEVSRIITGPDSSSREIESEKEGTEELVEEGSAVDELVGRHTILHGWNKLIRALILNFMNWLFAIS